ncbi:MAG: LIC_13355 family lipoprotein [Proteobacteria bacterium]|nr:LIC_13355 family lipoprotein [Pseudomonadota bacterium]
MKHIENFGLHGLVALVLILSCDPVSDIYEGEPHGPGAVLIITTDYETGSYSTIGITDRTVHSNIKVIHQDAICRYDSITELPYVIARLGSDAIDVIDPLKGWELVNEYSVGNGTNAQDIAVVSKDRAYVARLKAPDLLVVHPTEGTVLGSIDLADYADSDGLPEVTWLYHLDGKVYALLARLERFVPVDYSTLLVIDGASGVIEKSVPLSMANPSGRLRYNDVLKRFVLIESGMFRSLNSDNSLDGGIEYFNPKDNSISGLVITAEELGGDIIDAVIVSKSKGFAIVEQGKGTDVATRVVSFDPSRGKKLKDVITSEEWAYSSMELTPNNKELWLADRTRTAPGIRIFDTESDAELTEAPIDVGLPPFTLCFVNEDGKSFVDDSSVDNGEEIDSDAGLDKDGGITSEYADTVVEAPGNTGEGFGDANNAVNGVRGKGLGASSQDVFSMGYEEGIDNYIILEWSGQRVTNGPGTDLVVFENPFEYGSGGIFMDHIIVYFSRDGSTWVPFPHNYIYPEETEYSSDPKFWIGFAGVGPVLYHEEENPADPFDPEAAGGDHFDLDELPKDGGEAEAIRNEGFAFLKLVTAPSQINPDTDVLYVKDPISNGADIDGVYARYFTSR